MAQSTLDETSRSNGANRRQSRAPSKPDYPTSDQSNSALLQSYGSGPIGTGNRQLSRPERERARGGAANSTPNTPVFSQPKTGQGPMGSGRSQRSAIGATNTPAQFTPIPGNIMRAEVDRYERTTGNQYQPDAPQPQTAPAATNPHAAEGGIYQMMAATPPRYQPPNDSTPANPPASATRQPPAPSGAGGGGTTIYTGTGANGEPVFTDNKFPGSEVYGGQQMVGGDTDAVWSRMAGTPGSAIARVGSGPENYMGASRGPQRMQLDPRVQQMSSQLAGISEMLQSGRGPNGGLLTADGYQVLTSRANALDKGINEIYGVDADIYNNTTDNTNALDRQGLANQGQMDRQGLANQGQLDRTIASGTGDVNRARADVYKNELEFSGLPPFELPEVDYDNPNSVKARETAVHAANTAYSYIEQSGGDPFSARDALRGEVQGFVDRGGDLSEQDAMQLRLYRDALGMLNQSLSSGGIQIPRNQYGQQNFAEGGIVQAQRAPELGAPDGMNITSIQNYRKYVDMARQMGVDPIAFEQFSQMVAPQQNGQAPGMPEMQPNAQAAPQVFGMAEGGVVPEMGALQSMMDGQQVDGKLVMDTDPNAPTDSIPATIDGAQPAALDSGEFVLPKDVVMYYGTEKLSKLIEKARGPVQAAQGAMQGV